MPVNREDYTEQSIIVLTPTAEFLTADVIQETKAVIDSATAKYVIIDFKAIRFLVSGSLYPHAEPLKPLLKLNQQLQQEGRRLVLCNLNIEIAEVFRITRLDQIFEVQADVSESLSSINRKAD